MKKAIENNNKNIIKKSIVAGIIGFLSFILLSILFDPLAGLYKIGKFDLDTGLLAQPGKQSHNYFSKIKL